LAMVPSGLCPPNSAHGEVCGTTNFLVEMWFEQNDISMTTIVCQKGGLSPRWTIPSIHIHSKGYMLSNNMLWFHGIWLFYDAQSLSMTAFLTILFCE
jgi:hypothetical protein